MQTEPPKADPPKRRWFQFRLRTLFVVVTIAAVQCAACLPMLREWQHQEKLRRIGELLSRDFHRPRWVIGMGR